ncbi:MAG: hypothetical protein J4400_00615 [Candidatus Aenigmarchaeota archaeon]|nr:50S ribosomal protein L22P [uncultured archaeon]MBS3050638.1 hypothetical protein [Candidatus Aenigmarchaeota archaeon]
MKDKKTSPGQTFVPEQNYARAFGTSMRISQKSASLVCRAIKNKPLTRAKRLLEDLKAERRSLAGKYYSKAVKNMLALLNSCEKNAEFKGLDADRLFVHASAHKGANIRRRRRKGAFGSTMKNTNMEILLIERGKERKDKVSKKKVKEQMAKKPTAVEQEIKAEKEGLKREMETLKEEQKELQADVAEAEKRTE